MERLVGLADAEAWIDSLPDRDLVKSDPIYRLIAREAYLVGAARAEWVVVTKLRAEAVEANRDGRLRAGVVLNVTAMRWCRRLRVAGIKMV